MTGHDLAEFAMAMNDLERAYRIHVSPETIQSYAKGLEDLPWRAVEQALESVKKTSKTFPSIAAIREAVSSGRVDVGTQPRRGTYPDDIAARRRALGLPVTPEEQEAYDRQTEAPTGRLSRMERARVLRESVAHVKSEPYRDAILRLVAILERGQDVSDSDVLAVFTGAVVI